MYHSVQTPDSQVSHEVGHFEKKKKNDKLEQILY